MLAVSQFWHLHCALCYAVASSVWSTLLPVDFALGRFFAMTYSEFESVEEDIEGLEAREQEARSQAVRENAKRILRDSGLPEMLQGINRNLLKGRGHFEEYDSLVLLRWGTQSTSRHLWIEV